jgi:hypothetical protein
MTKIRWPAIHPCLQGENVPQLVRHIAAPDQVLLLGGSDRRDLTPEFNVRSQQARIDEPGNAAHRPTPPIRSRDAQRAASGHLSAD